MKSRSEVVIGTSYGRNKNPPNEKEKSKRRPILASAIALELNNLQILLMLLVYYSVKSTDTTLLFSY